MDLSNREKEIWIELIVSIAVAIYYFTHAFNLGGFNNLTDPGLGKVVVNAILISIASTIILNIVFAKKNTEAKDERDIAIEAKANSFAYYSLCVFCTLIIGQVMITEGIGYFSQTHPVPVNAASIMHYLLIAIILSGTVKSSIQIFRYRRGY
ncbi:hypothetical protein [Pseudemcibacter aquimaris]|uniref:hypothetical protein n=1 Tax=Pseudemcibacter aquimaris TaxID=2857064 RepID=UPI002011F231|nr:hypothetical protein [Pseudemcibacter aquimaris]MCC3861126.1 hypothetical protein [Pseudemcibacter aquimaris]WDU59943.1 hypothetical protein KW060_06700 [Pseudemcibacter aquimaris]